MNAVLDTLNLSKFNITEEFSEFTNPNIGALYLPEEEDFSEINQEILTHSVLKNRFEPIEGYDECVLDCYPDDIYFEKSFKTLDKAEDFVKGFFNYFDEIDNVHCANIIKKLRQFTGLISSDKKLGCRFEIVSGNSCKKFHVDSVNSRLIYTCAGPGTQVKHPDRCMHITLPSGSAIIVKGTKFPEFKTVTLHRSPPIEDLDLRRFIFIADYVQ